MRSYTQLTRPPPGQREMAGLGRRGHIREPPEGKKEGNAASSHAEKEAKAAVPEMDTDCERQGVPVPSIWAWTVPALKAPVPVLGRRLRLLSPPMQAASRPAALVGGNVTRYQLERRRPPWPSIWTHPPFHLLHYNSLMKLP